MCFLIGATGPGVTKTGEAIIGGVSDDPYNFRTFVRSSSPKGAAYCHIGTEMCYVEQNLGIPPPFKIEKGQPSRGINEAGLAFTCALAIEEVPKEDKKVLKGQSLANLSHRLMNSCSSVDEAIDVLLSAESVAPPSTVLLADANGDIAQVEVGSFGCRLYKKYSKNNPGVIVAVNCYQSAELCCHNLAEAKLDNPSNNNGKRLKRGWEIVNRFRGNITVQVIASILSDHQNADKDCSKNPVIPYWGYSICNHGTRSISHSLNDATLPAWGTVSSEIMKPGTREFHYCYGWPCGQKPQYEDQTYQGDSWGKFLAFSFQKNHMFSESKEYEDSGSKEIEAESVKITTVFGKVTKEGKNYLRI